MATFTADMERLTKDLIQIMTGFEPTEENFNICYKFAKSNFRFHRYLNADELKVTRSIQGLCEKFSIHCQTEKAEALHRLTETFLNSNLERNFPKSSAHYGTLQLLLCLSESPIHSKYTPLASIEDQAAAAVDNFDWRAYLMEGIEYPSYNEPDDTSLWQYPEDAVTKPSRSSVTPRKMRTKAVIKQREHLQDSISYEAHTDKLERLVAMSSWDWLMKHVTTPYWALGAPPIHHSYGNKVPSLPNGLGQVFLESRKQSNPLHVVPEMTIINEEYLTRETLWALLGAEKCFVYKFDSDRTHVQEDLLVEDITPLALHNVLQHFAAVITLVHRLRLFIKQQSSLDGGCVCETYKAFANSLMLYLEMFDRRLRKLEKEMVEKTSFVSILGLISELQPLLQELQDIHGVLMRGTTPKSAANLLTCLWDTLCQYDVLGSSTSCRSTVIFPVWFMTIHPYTVMLDNWMRSGTLPDQQNEFCVQRNNQNAAVKGLAYWNDNFSFQDLPVFLQPVKQQVMLAGKSMQLIESVGYLKQVEEEEEALEGHTPTPSLFEELLDTFRAEVVTISSRIGDRSQGPIPDPTAENESGPILGPTAEHEPGPIPGPTAECESGPIPGPTAGVSSVDPIPNPACSEIELFDPHTIWRKDLLTKQFVSELMVHKDPSLNKHHDPLWEELLQLAGLPLHKPLASILEGCIQTLVQKRYVRASGAVMKLLNRTYMLTEHLRTVRLFFLMEAGDVMYQFYSDIFQRILNQEPWQHDSYLNAMFQEALRTRFCSAFGKNISVLCTEVSKEISMNILLSLSMEYEIQWPLNIIFNEQVMHTYNEIFCFLLQVKWAKWCLEGLRQRTDTWMALPADLRHKVQLLHHLKSQLLHFINILNNFLMTRILHSTVVEFQKGITAVEDIDTLISMHDQYVNTIFDRCLLNKKASYIKEAIMKILNLTLHFRQRWERGLERFSTADAERVEAEFTKCTHFIVSFLEKAVEKGSYPHLETLAFSLSTLKQRRKIFGSKS